MARKSKNKPLKFKVAIVGEGETEWYYSQINELVKKLREYK